MTTTLVALLSLADAATAVIAAGHYATEAKNNAKAVREAGDAEAENGRDIGIRAVLNDTAERQKAKGGNNPAWYIADAIEAFYDAARYEQRGKEEKTFLQSVATRAKKIATDGNADQFDGVVAGRVSGVRVYKDIVKAAKAERDDTAAKEKEARETQELAHAMQEVRATAFDNLPEAIGNLRKRLATATGEELANVEMMLSDLMSEIKAADAKIAKVREKQRKSA